MVNKIQVNPARGKVKKKHHESYNEWTSLKMVSQNNNGTRLLKV